MAMLTELLADLATSTFLETARVTTTDRLSEHFVTVELQCPAFRSATWTPGAKLQLRPRRGTLGLRTYTPFDWDDERGTTRVLAFTHGAGPASDWFTDVRPGDDCELFGPRRSIDLRTEHERVLFVGDESSLGLACALRSIDATATHVVESVDPHELSAVLDGLDLSSAVVVPRADDHAPLRDAARRAAHDVGAPFDLVLTGDAAAVHTVRRDTRGWTPGPDRIKGKAYWAAGRTGLD
ncbi:siderophore-interacting protein [Pseudonocardia endophytica]|uniref:NADPH-dependent ferric siderophore reductase n=1 Tax=Pseudonocardia endophytica TaxID=401976 RepID=A0A4V6NDF4_PSEEN|nr:siderophore-interacting protein [Pseudonocardia endophytica]TCK22186.1 NADPH-dependent ferric siderophore reductase [Pseudonocardia endophytica]